VLKVKNPDRFIYYLVTKDRTGGGCYPTYSALESSLKAMREHMINNEVKELAMPTIGCGLDRLQWDKVEGMLRDVFGNDDLNITVYKFVPK
jgi:O-acetyl-ADP-ribose deacetylase (regulator of RNase III)